MTSYSIGARFPGNAREVKHRPREGKKRATHLLQANYDIHVIQKLLGHPSLKATMIYTHCVQPRTVKEPKSPPDF